MENDRYHAKSYVTSSVRVRAKKQSTGNDIARTQWSRNYLVGKLRRQLSVIDSRRLLYFILEGQSSKDET